MTGRDAERLEAAVKEIGPAATGVQADVTALSDLDVLYDRVREEAGRIDVLVAGLPACRVPSAGSSAKTVRDG